MNRTTTTTTANSTTTRQPDGERARLARLVVPSPIGPLELIAHETALVAIRWDVDGDDAQPDAHNPVDRELGRHAGGPIEDVEPGAHAVLDRAAEQLDEYFAGRRIEFDLPLDPSGTEFQRAAWEALVRIPFGETISYGEQARMLGDVNKSRAVGAANGRNPIPIVVPCHRVVGSNGQLTGFAGGLATKAWLLDHEFGVRARS